MLDYKYADLYYEDSIDKQLKVEAEDGSVITNEDIYLEEVTLDESICSDESLTFGCCEASKFEIKIANRFSPLIDQWLTVSEVIDGHEDDPFVFGKYKVQSDKPAADRIYRNIIAYDSMYDILNADKTEVADWYNSILPNDDSTVTLKTFRTSFINHFGIEEEEATLPNDDMIVEKTIAATELSGKAVINAICEINGCFGHIGRDGKFQYIFLEVISTNENASILGEMILGTAVLGGAGISQELDGSKYRASDYEDYECQTIDKVLIQETEDDAGGWAGDGENCYTITNNFLVYGKDLDEIQRIAQKILSTISGLVYRPATITATGNPCLIVGDSISLDTKYQHIDTYILQRTLKGIQALVDTYVAEGTEIYTNNGNSIESVIDQLKGKSNVLTRDLDQTKSEIKDVENNLSSTITQTVTSIETQINDVEKGLSSQITQTANEFSAQVSEVKEIASNAVIDGIPYYAVSTNPDWYPPHEADGDTAVLGEMVLGKAVLGFSGSDWTEEQPEYQEGIYIWVSSYIEKADEKGSHWSDPPTLLTDEYLRQFATETSEKYSQLTLDIETATLEVYNLSQTLYGNYSTTTETHAYIEEVADEERASILTEVSGTYATKNDLSGYTNTAGMEAYVTEKLSSIKLEVENGELGSKASIKLTAGDTSTSGSLDLTNVRDAFAEDNSQIEISAGRVTFNSGTLVINSGNLTLDSSGNAVFSGTLNAPSGNIGGWTIGDESLYNGTSSMTSTTTGTYIGIDGIRQYRSSSYYVDIQNGRITAYGANISGTITATTLTCENGTIAGFTIKSYAIYKGTSALTDNDEGVYLGNDGIKVVTSSGANAVISAGNARVELEGLDGSISYLEHSQMYGYDSDRIRTFYFTGRGLMIYDYDGNRWLQVNTFSDSTNRLALRHADVFLYKDVGDTTSWLSAANEYAELGITGSLLVNGSYVTGSDESLKTDISLLSSQNQDYEKVVDSLTPVTFEYKSESGKKKHIGFTYQNAVEALEAGGIDPDDSAMVQLTEDPNTGEKVGGIEYNDIIALLVYEVQKLKSEIDEMKAS